MTQQTRITPQIAMRVRDVSRPGDGRTPAEPPAGAGTPAPDARTGASPEAETKTPPLSRKGERRRLRRLHKSGGQV